MQKVRKGDHVKILAGKDNSKVGVVARLSVKKGRVWVQGINISKRHVKKQQGLEGGIIDIVKSVDLSNVMLVCPSCKKPTRVGFQKEGDVYIRVCKKCKKEVT